MGFKVIYLVLSLAFCAGVIGPDLIVPYIGDHIKKIEMEGKLDHVMRVDIEISPTVCIRLRALGLGLEHGS